jgi:glycosyltransferase involved in cell wall biosynthesis
MGGEAMIPYHYFRLLKESDWDPVLLVHERNREELKDLFPQFAEDIYYIKDTWLQKILWRIGERLPKRIAEVTFFYWVHISSGIRMRKRAKTLIADRNIDIVHQPIPVSPKQPSFFFGMGVPVVIAPMNGGMEFPPAFKGKMRLAEKIAYSIGKSIAAFGNVLIPGKRRADLLLAANPRTLRSLADTVGDAARTELLVENAVDLDLWSLHVDGQDSVDVPVFVFVGRLIDLKGVDLLLIAFQRLLERMAAKLLVVGNGPEEADLAAQAQELGISAAVSFLGFVEQDDIPAIVAKCRALVLPSLHDCGGAVVLEAMSLGKPVIATNWGGPADYLDPSCGILVDPLSEESFVGGLVDAMLRLAMDPALAAKLGANGRKKVERDFDWRKKVDSMIGHYSAVLRARERASQLEARS